MQEVNIVFPHHLFRSGPLLTNGNTVCLVEEYLFFRYQKFHKQKIAFHRASMRSYAHFLQDSGVQVMYIAAYDERSDIRELIPWLGAKGVKLVHYFDPVDNWLEQRLAHCTDEAGMQCRKYVSPLFINTPEDLRTFFRADKKKFFQTEFYIDQRKKRRILVDDAGKPVGGKWSFDAENRKKYPKKKIPPLVTLPAPDAHHTDAAAYVNKYFAANPGALSATSLYPTSHAASDAWLDQFLRTRFEEFGPYEDAIVADQNVLHHSVLTPMLNVGLLTPAQVIQAALDHGTHFNYPMNSIEGFVRQVLGWREFIRGIYECKGSYQRTTNFWGFSRKIPASFYDGTTGILPVDVTIRKVLQTGYCHHIERLMVLGNFMLLCAFDPDEVYRWFMEMFVDAYDWVMVPNIYGMSQFADGGLMATKPYISGSNYLKKMSDYPPGDWQKTWDGLFWRFMHVHRDFFTYNPRLGMLVRMFDKMSPDKREAHLTKAENYLATL